MSVTESGISIALSPVHFSNDQPPIKRSAEPFSNVTSVRAVQPEKQLSGNISTTAGITTF
jgi:hypothetical protein